MERNKTKKTLTRLSKANKKRKQENKKTSKENKKNMLKKWNGIKQVITIDKKPII